MSTAGPVTRQRLNMVAQGPQGLQGLPGPTSGLVPVNQVGHGFSTGQAVYYSTDSGKWALASAAAAKSLGVGLVTVSDTNNFTIWQIGLISGLSGLSTGSYYYVSDSVPGALSPTPPTAATSYSEPILLALSASTGLVLPYRGVGVAASAAVIVRVNSGGTGGAQASPYSANPGETVVIDSSTGNVVVNLPTLALGQSVETLHDQNTSLATNTVTINAPGAANIGQPPPNNAAGFVSSYVYGGASHGGEGTRGTSIKYSNVGSAGGYVAR